MISDNIVSVLHNLPQELSKELNVVWDKIHGISFPESLYHHSIENTQYSVLDKWFNIRYDDVYNEIIYGYAWQDDQCKDVLKKIETFIYNQKAETAELIKRRFCLTLYLQRNATYLITKLLDRLMKLKNKGKFDNNQCKYHFTIIEQYKINNKTYHDEYIQFRYDYKFYQSIIDICKTSLRGENLC